MTFGDERLSKLKDLAFAAALDDSLWITLTDALTEQVGGDGGTFVVLETDTRSPRAVEMVRHIAEARQEYEAFWWQHDPRWRLPAR
jgi:hypothetical protein